MREQESIKVLRKIFNSERWFGAFFDAVFYSEADSEIIIHTNAIDKLRTELANLDHKPLISIGATYDPYQHFEKDYELTLKGLELIKEFNFPVVITTGQELILRDLDILESINAGKKAWVVFKMEHYDIALLDAVRMVAERGIKTGIMAKSSFLFESDDELIERFVNEAKEHNCSFIIPIYLLENSYIEDDYKREYAYNDTFYKACEKVDLNTKMPLYDEDFMHTKQINLFDLSVK